MTEHVVESDLPGCVELSAEFISAMVFGMVPKVKEPKKDKAKGSKK